jgi:hypothetical protein
LSSEFEEYGALSISLQFLGLLFNRHHQDELIKEDELGGSSSSDAGMTNAYNISNRTFERKI